MKILALDDELAVLQALRLILEDAGHTVDCFQDAELAVAKVQSGGYDFALVDYHMPEKNGAWFLKNAAIPPTTRTLLLTAYANRDVINEMFRCGVAGYIIKPFDQAELLRHLAFHSARGSA